MSVGDGQLAWKRGGGCTCSTIARCVGAAAVAAVVSARASAASWPIAVVGCTSAAATVARGQRSL